MYLFYLRKIFLLIKGKSCLIKKAILKIIIKRSRSFIYWYNSRNFHLCFCSTENKNIFTLTSLFLFIFVNILCM